MKTSLLALFSCILLLNTEVQAQDNNTQAIKSKKVHGTFYVTWGYHRDQYTRSNIHFEDHQTGDYDFTLYHAKASDRIDLYKDFIHEPITIPQYVFYGGYFFGNKGDWGIEFGWDHLKYIVNDNQVMHMKGEINGQQFNQDTLVTPNFLHYEHTNGNNYLMVNAVKKFTFFRSPKEVHRLSALAKLGGGVTVPKTYSVIMGHENDGPFRPSGFVMGASASLRYDLFRHFFIEHSVKGCLVDYTWVKLWGDGRAHQTFASVQYVFSFGYYIPMSKKF
ncbi:MAG TPA: hypothetical protein VNB90_08195 [Cytophagaceae bacterium]|nr:hypothetical protein [Cytophagaceae bacterium]